MHNYASVVKVIFTSTSYSRHRGKTPRIRYFDTGRYSSCDFDYRYVTYTKVQCKEVKTQEVVICNNVVNWTTCFGLLGGHHQVLQAIWYNIFHGFKLLDVEISSPTFCMAIYREKTMRSAAASVCRTARHRNQGADPTSNLYLCPRHTLAATDLIVFSLYIAIQKADDEISTSNSLNPWNTL